MDCKAALLETDGDQEAAADYLRTKVRDAVVIMTGRFWLKKQLVALLFVVRRAGFVFFDSYVLHMFSIHHGYELPYNHSLCEFMHQPLVDFFLQGLAKADKKASRVAAEGKIAVSQKDGKAVMVEVNCETDFVAKDGNFIGFCDQVAEAAVGVDGDSVEDLVATKAGDDTIEAIRQGLVAKIGENIQVRRMVSRGDGSNSVGAYVHMNKIGVMVEMEGGNEDLCKDVAMHIAAMNPPFATPDDVPAEVLEKEKKFLSDQALESGKPAEIVEKMVEGTLRSLKFFFCKRTGESYG